MRTLMLTRDLKFHSTGNLGVAYALIASHPRLCALAIAAIAMTAWQAAQAANLEPRTVGQITYLCGGVGQDEQQAMRAQAGNFDRGLLFTSGSRGKYLGGVDVRLSRNDEEVASFKADGPRCFITGPDSTYQVTATYNGVQKRTTLARGQRNVQLRW
jgi:opacity protein-like surface antigen